MVTQTTLKVLYGVACSAGVGVGGWVVHSSLSLSLASSSFGVVVLTHLLVLCGGVELRRITILPGPSLWISGYVDNRSGFGEEDDSNTGEVRENLCWCSEYCEAQSEA